MYLGCTRKITTLIYILLCGFQMTRYTWPHLMDVIWLIFHDTTFEAIEAQRIPHPITSNRGVDLLTPQLLLAFILQAHVQQREPPELVHKIHPFPGISLLKLKKKLFIFGCSGSSALCRFFSVAVSRGYPSLRWVHFLPCRLLLLQSTGQLQLFRQVSSGVAASGL